MINTLSTAEIGNLLESLPTGKRETVWSLVNHEDDGKVLLHVGDEVRESLLATMDMEEIIAAVEDLDIDNLANLVDDLPNTVIDQRLQSMDGESRKRLEQAISYPEDSVGRLMNPDTITVHANVNVDMVLGQLRLRAELRDHTDNLYVVSHHHQYLGRVSLATLVTHQPNTQPSTSKNTLKKSHANFLTTTGSPPQSSTKTTPFSAISLSTTSSTSSVNKPNTKP
ncbi:Mg++ transporter [Xylella fastidiosa]|nr:Mg++ transporter [Xylella fastidiosa]